MFPTLFPDRFKLLKSLFLFYLGFSFLIRVGLYIESFSQIDFSLTNLVSVFGLGLFFDIGSISFIMLPYALYLILFPKQWHGNKLDKFLTKFSFFLVVFILNFSFLAEITFWDEYHKRFNFISVDYLLYTYEVVNNINESYSLTLIISIIIVLTILVSWLLHKKRVFDKTFLSHDALITKLPVFFLVVLLSGVYYKAVRNTDAEKFDNQYENELSKSGVYSFFAAYNSNELNYNSFYKTENIGKLIAKFKRKLEKNGVQYLNNFKNPLARIITNSGDSKKPNIMFVCIESMNAGFMARYGNKGNQTPHLDKLMEKSISFTNLQATGTRTIRGLEAISMCIPPTPGRSIIKRENKPDLFNIADVFKSKGYSRTFFYGGDSHFDNMIYFFGNNGYDIVDHKEENRFEADIPTKRIHIDDSESTFENAWGVCDEDLFNKVLKVTDQQHKTGQPFFNFIMTSSNHPPFTFPDGKINFKETDTHRSRAVKYTDYAINQFMTKVKTKPWFGNTIFVFTADHNAYSAGRTEINASRYHIPTFIYNLEKEPQEWPQLSSQIDIFPTIFGLLNWSYNSKLMGQDIRKMTPADERAFISNHRKLVYRKKNDLVILDTHKDSYFYNWVEKGNILNKIPKRTQLEKEAIMYYQTAYELYKSGLMNRKFTKK